MVLTLFALFVPDLDLLLGTVQSQQILSVSAPEQTVCFGLSLSGCLRVRCLSHGPRYSDDCCLLPVYLRDYRAMFRQERATWLLKHQV